MKSPFVLLGAAAGVALIALVVVFFAGERGGPSPVVALPSSATALYYEVSVHTRDGKEVTLAPKQVTCTLVAALSESEGLYDCPAPYDLTPYLSPEPVVQKAPSPGHALSVGRERNLVTFVKAATIVSGLPANSWQTVQINYGATLSAPVAVQGQELAKGETGHIENTTNQNTTRGVFSTNFKFRANTNGSGYMGTEWLAIGN